MGVLTWTGLRRPNQWEPFTLLDHLISSPLTLFAIIFYRIVLFLRGHVFHPPRGKAPVRVVCISDTHDQTVSNPSGDILIHAGDLTNAGTVSDIQVQLDWLKAQPHPVKIVIAGNHDSWFDERSRLIEDAKTGVKPNMEGLTYLQSSLTVPTVKGRQVAIFGVPDIPECGPKSYAFQYKPASQPWLSKVPPETDILVTHCPPKHHRDLGLGDPHLLRELWRVKPRLHVFGHIHYGAGTEPAYFDDFQAAYEQLMSRTRRGPIFDFFPSQLWLDLVKVLYFGVESVLWKWLMKGPRSNNGSLMVNAAQVQDKSMKVKNKAVVVDI